MVSTIVADSVPLTGRKEIPFHKPMPHFLSLQKDMQEIPMSLLLLSSSMNQYVIKKGYLRDIC